MTVDPNMMENDVENHIRGLERKMFEERSSGNRKPHFNKLGDGVDHDYAWLLSFLTDDTNGQTNSSLEKVIDDDKDPQYCMFLKALTKNGKSYKLKISKTDEPPKFLVYEESDVYVPPIYTNTNTVKSSEEFRVKRKFIATKKFSSEKRSKGHRSVAEFDDVDSCYQKFLEGCIESEYGAFMYEGNRVNYEEKDTNTGSDSEIEMWEEKKKQPITPQKESSLREELMLVLSKPYDKEEHKSLSEYVLQKRQICRLLPLRDRAVSSALEGVKKSVLDDASKRLKKKLKAAENDPPRALNLLRMFVFWIQHVPNEDVFQPWLDEECLEVLPGSRG